MHPGCRGAGAAVVDLDPDRLARPAQGDRVDELGAVPLSDQSDPHRDRFREFVLEVSGRVASLIVV